MALLGLVIADVDLGTELHLLDLDLGLLLASLLCLDLLLVLVLAVIHDAAHRRLGVGCDLDQVETLLGSDTLGIRVGKDAELCAIDTNQANGGGADCVVDPRLLSGYCCSPPIKKPVSTGLTGLAELPGEGVCTVDQTTELCSS